MSTDAGTPTGPTYQPIPQENNDEHHKHKDSFVQETEILDVLQVPVAPDGAYGWVICACAFFVMLILDGMLFTFGVLFLELLDYFKESKSKTAWVGSTLMGTHLLVGPLTSALVNAWGLRPVAMVGACLATASFAASAMAPSIDVLIFTYGIMGGVGLSMAYIPSILAVGFYFEKRRALANGISTSGSGVGTFVFAPLCEFLQDKYGWRGALLIISGLVLNCLVFVSLFRPLEHNTTKKRLYISTKTVASTYDVTMKEKEDHCDGIVGNGYIRKGSEPKYGVNTNHDFIILESQTESKYNKVKMRKNSYGRILRSSTTELQNKLFTGSTLSIDDLKMLKKLKSQKYENVSMINVNNLNDSLVSLRTRRRLTIDMLNKPLYRKDIFYSGSVMKLDNSQDNLQNIESLYHDLEEIVETDNEENYDITQEGNYKHNLCKGLRLVAGMSILKRPVFLLAVAMSILWTAHAAVLTILPNHATLSGISARDASFLVSIIGITNIVGRVLSGWLADRFDCIVINAVALFMGGVASFMFPFTVNYYLLCAQSAIFGIGMGSWTSLRPIVLVHILGIDNLTNAFGVLAMFQGAAFCIGSPLAGLLYDFTQSYELPFLVAGSAFIASFLLCIPLRILGKRKKVILFSDDIILREISPIEE